MDNNFHLPPDGLPLDDIIFFVKFIGYVYSSYDFITM